MSSSPAFWYPYGPCYCQTRDRDPFGKREMQLIVAQAQHYETGYKRIGLERRNDNNWCKVEEYQKIRVLLSFMLVLLIGISSYIYVGQEVS